MVVPTCGSLEAISSGHSGIVLAPCVSSDRPICARTCGRCSANYSGFPGLHRQRKHGRRCETVDRFGISGVLLTATGGCACCVRHIIPETAMKSIALRLIIGSVLSLSLIAPATAQ